MLLNCAVEVKSCIGERLVSLFIEGARLHYIERTGFTGLKLVGKLEKRLRV